MEELSDEQVVRLFPAIEEAGRADRRTAQRFVQPRTGILEETAARRHQFVFGRRGVGKSTLLRKIESEHSAAVIFVDIETLRGRPYPDVLSELLIDLLTKLETRLRPPWARFYLCPPRWRAIQGVRGLTTSLRQLLEEPQVAQRTVQALRSRKLGASVGAGFEFKPNKYVGPR